MEVVTQQAAKSRRHITDRGFWRRVGRRLSGGERPPLRLLSGDPDDIRAMCGLIAGREDESIVDNPPVLEAKIVIVQPGLSMDLLRQRLEIDDLSAGQVREYLTFLHNAVGGLGALEVLCSE